MIKETHKHGKRIVVDIDDIAEKKHFDGYIISKKRYLKYLGILFGGYLILSTFLIIVNNQDILLFIFIIFIGTFLTNIHLFKNMYSSKFPDYFVFVRGNKKVDKDLILAHEMMHFKIMEKLLKHKELYEFFDMSLDKLTAEQLSIKK